MNAIEQVVANSATIYMPKGKEVGECTAFLREIGIIPPDLSDDVPQGLDEEGRQYTRMRATDGVRLLERGFGEKAIAFAGTDVCDNLIDSKPDTSLSYAAFGTDKPMCTFELLLPKNPTDSLLRRIQGEGRPVPIVTSRPRMLARCALDRGLNIVPADYVPDGNVEIMVRLGIAEAAADIVTSGRSAEAAGLSTSKTKNRLEQLGNLNTVLQPVYGAVVWRKICFDATVGLNR